MAERRVALVTGGARRLGAAFSRVLARRGYVVAIHHRQSHAEAAALGAEIASAGGESHTFAADLADPQAPAALVRDVVERCGRLDVVVNSAANMLRTPVGSVTAEQLDEIFALNTRAPFLIAQAAAAAMTDGGVIVNMADLAAFETWAGYIPHAMSKAAIVQMTRALARVLAPRIRVNAIAPGVVLLPDGWDGAASEHLAATTPLRRHGSPDDVMRAFEYLLDAPFVTGEVLFVDGGRHVRR
ncbi:MAG: SDR family oxidoreductase [Gemmatimonadetes bacterium]|jgi:pteridine reductase|nr:SDR family oxidoreductase [Gemmatimonadota bacterium]MBK6841739.1 SDR family oxidoreductase [Gemmatimonadota bacterium]MBK7835441.1 SDR family oxidoreductase [Gemmatimonadota bacterium]MBP9107166.1 SDR family oxidoreductase [Gemmatimonadaceae bacterium]